MAAPRWRARTLLVTDFGAWVAGLLLVPDAHLGYADVAEVDACPLPSPALCARQSTWRCGVCVTQDRWGVRSLGESMLTFGSTLCSAKSAVYSVLTYYHADSHLPKASFLHGCVPPGAPAGNIKDQGLVDELRQRQNRRRARGGPSLEAA